jgi:hypothetical protein
MTKSVPLFLMLLLVSGCAQNAQMSGGGDNTGDLFKAVHEYSNCVHENAARLDDHVTDAAVIGDQIAAVCRSQFEMTNEIALRGVDPSAGRAFLAERYTMASRTPTNVVKAMRAIQVAQNTRTDLQ